MHTRMEVDSYLLYVLYEEGWHGLLVSYDNLVCIMLTMLTRYSIFKIILLAW